MWLLFGAPPAYVHHVVDNIVKQRVDYEVALRPLHHANWYENLSLYASWGPASSSPLPKYANHAPLPST